MFQILAGALAFFYGLIPNYAIAIALLTLAVMLVLSPLTLKSTRSMLAMQKLQPEMKRLQQKHKGGDRQKLNEEMLALYKEHKVNPVAGCLPMILQAPVLFVMYHVISGLTRRGEGGGFAPKYLDEGTELYQALVSSGGKMVSFGIDLARSASDSHASLGAALPYFVVVALVVFSQYYQTRQTMARNAQAAANPQQQMLMKVMPVVFGLISLSIPAGVNVYFLGSALFRIAQTAAMYRWDPTLKAHVKERTKEVEAKAVEVKPKQGTKPAKPAKTKAAGKPPAKAKNPAKGPSPGKEAARKDGAKTPAKGPVVGKGPKAKGTRGNGGRPQKRRAKKGR